MNENAEKWVAALRSGDYDQTKSFLRDEDGFCCLGVACDLYAKETGGTARAWRKSGRYYVFAIGSPHEVSALPVPVMEWLGLRDQLGDYDPVVNMASLSTRNDNGAEFAEIAYLIESEPKGLFHE